MYWAVQRGLLWLYGGPDDRDLQRRVYLFGILVPCGVYISYR